MDKTPITPQTNIAELIRVYPQVVPLLIEHHMACVGCSMSEFESLEDAAQVYHLSLDTLLAAIQNIAVHTEKNTPLNFEGLYDAANLRPLRRSFRRVNHSTRHKRKPLSWKPQCFATSANKLLSAKAAPILASAEKTKT